MFDEDMMMQITQMRLIAMTMKLLLLVIQIYMLYR